MTFALKKNNDRLMDKINLFIIFQKIYSQNNKLQKFKYEKLFWWRRIFKFLKIDEIFWKKF